MQKDTAKIDTPKIVPSKINISFLQVFLKHVDFPPKTAPQSSFRHFFLELLYRVSKLLVYDLESVLKKLENNHTKFAQPLFEICTF